MPGPTSLPPPYGFNVTDTAGSVNHGTDLHVVDRDEIRALWTKLGLGASTPGGTAAVLRRTATGQSAWGQVVDADIADGITAAKVAPGAKGSGLLSGATAGIWEPVIRKNRLINGSGGVAQRIAVDALVAVSDNTYQAQDRWRSISNITAGTVPDVSHRNNLTTAGKSRTYLQMIARGGTGKFGFLQVIESYNCNDLRGQVVSLQASIHVAASLTNVKMAVLYQVGTADATTADPVTTWNTTTGGGVTAWNGWTEAGLSTITTATTTPTTFKLENVSIHSNATNVAVMIWQDRSDPSSGDTLNITDVQLEKGSVCTDFERVPIGQELLACQRYYVKIGQVGSGLVLGFGQVYGATACMIQITLPVVMRGLPAFSYSALTDFYFATANFATSDPPTGIATYSVQGNAYALQCTGVPAGAFTTPGHTTMMLIRAAGAALNFSSEL